MSGAPIVLIGEERLFPILKSRKRIWDRVTQCIEFRPISAEDVVLFGLKAAELRIESEAAARIAARAAGSFRLIWSDVRDCEQMARAAGTKSVDAKMVGGLQVRGPERKSVKKGAGNGDA
jgi:hypothetical protein